jgi:hypothetical protein
MWQISTSQPPLQGPFRQVHAATIGERQNLWFPANGS